MNFKEFLFDSILLNLLLLINKVNSEKILCLFPSPIASHLVIETPVANELFKRGHNVTVISVLSLKALNPNIEHIIIELPEYQQKLGKTIQTSQSYAKYGSALSTPLIFVSLIEMATALVKHETMQNILKEREYDLVVLGYVANEIHLGIGAHFKCPIILFWVNQPLTLVNSLIGNPDEISYVPLFFSEVMQPMNFQSRLKNFVVNIFEKLRNAYLHYYIEKDYNEIFSPQKGYPSYSEMLKNVSIVLNAAHFSDSVIRPVVPGFIEIGGIQIKEKPHPLPKKLSTFLDSADSEGAILFSLGTAAKSSELNQTIISNLFNTFSNLTQKVIWKWETDVYPGKSANIFFGKWLPQDDILAHKNTRLFISHGGIGGIAEARYHGVPILGMPIYLDQFTNIEAIEKAGWAEIVHIRNFDMNLFQEIIKKMLNNPKYKNTVKKISNIYKDRPLSAMKTAMFWIEYVMRHNGAKHIQSPLIHLNFYQYHSIDVVCFLFIFLIILYKFVKYVVIFLVNSLGRKKKKE